MDQWPSILQADPWLLSPHPHLDGDSASWTFHFFLSDEACSFSTSYKLQSQASLSIFLVSRWCFQTMTPFTCTPIKCLLPGLFCTFQLLLPTVPNCSSAFYKLSGTQPEVLMPFVLRKLSNHTPQPHSTWPLPVLQSLPAKDTPWRASSVTITTSYLAILFSCQPFSSDLDVLPLSFQFIPHDPLYSLTPLPWSFRLLILQNLR